jgi:wobble nucleotide-excising tRNase
LDDVPAQVTVDEPATVLSSSQLNVLALSTFLALNLAVESLPLHLVVLDDPLQSLDTVNLFGLADLLRRVREVRQVVVSTHDARLASLLARKLRPVDHTQRTRTIALEGWTREGPTVRQEEIGADPSPLRLVASA